MDNSLAFEEGGCKAMEGWICVFSCLASYPLSGPLIYGRFSASAQ